MPVRERQLALSPSPDVAYGREAVAPLDAALGRCVDHDLPQDRAVDLGPEVERVDVLLCVFGDEDVALRVADAVGVGLRARVLREDLPEAVLAQGALAAVVAEVEHAAEVGAGVDARLTLVDRRGDAAPVEGDEEGEAGGSAAYDRDTRVRRNCHLGTIC